MSAMDVTGTGPAGAGAGPAPMGSVMVTDPATGKTVRRSARLNNLEELTKVTEQNADLVSSAVTEAIQELSQQSGGGYEDEPMGVEGPAGAGAGPSGLAGTGVLMDNDIAPDPMGPGGAAELAAMVVGESLNAAYSAATSETVKEFAGDLKDSGNAVLDSLETVVVSMGDLFMDTVGNESAEVAVDTLKKLGGLGYWLLKGAGGIVILGLSLANFVAGTGKGLAEAGSNGIRALANKLRSDKTQEQARDAIIENSPLAILTAIAVFNQLGMLPLVTIGSMALSGLQQQVSPTGRSLWLIYLFKWWIGLSKKEKEQVQSYTKEVAATGAGKVGEGATLVASAIAEAYKQAKVTPPPMADLESNLARAKNPKGGKMSGADRGAAQVLAEEAAVAMAVLDFSDSDVETPDARTKLAQLKAGVAKAIQKVGEKKRDRSGASTPASVAPPEPVRRWVPPRFVPGSAVPPPEDEDEEMEKGEPARVRGRVEVRKKGRDASGSPEQEEGRDASRSRERKKVNPVEQEMIRLREIPRYVTYTEAELREKAEKNLKNKRGGKRKTAKAKRKTFRKKKVAKKTRKFIY